MPFSGENTVIIKDSQLNSSGIVIMKKNKISMVNKYNVD